MKKLVSGWFYQKQKGCVSGFLCCLFQFCIGVQGGGVVGFFLGEGCGVDGFVFVVEVVEFFWFVVEVVIGRGLLVYWVDQVQYFDDVVWVQVEVFVDQFFDFVVVDFVGVEGGD